MTLYKIELLIDPSEIFVVISRPDSRRCLGAYMVNGRPRKRPKLLIKPDDFDPPTAPIVCDPREIAAIDPGYHNTFSAVRWTGEYDNKGERVFEKRFVTKKRYDRRPRRKTIRRRAAARTHRAQNQGLLDAVTQQ